MTDQPRERDRIRCLECGRWYRALPTHLRRSHGMGDEDYRLKYFIAAGVPLVCLDWSERMSRKNIEKGMGRNLTAGPPAPGFRQRESVRRRLAPQYARLAASGLAARAALDKTARRRERLRPYPVTLAQAIERLGCSRSAASMFLRSCVARGRLRRIGWGLYDEIRTETEDQP